MEWNGEEMKIWWRKKGSNGVHVKERKKKRGFVIFLSPQVTKPPYYAKTLANSWPLDQKIKCQDKILAIGSNQSKPTWDKTQHLLEKLTRSALARRDERKSQKRKNYGKNVQR